MATRVQYSETHVAATKLARAAALFVLATAPTSLSAQSDYCKPPENGVVVCEPGEPGIEATAPGTAGDEWYEGYLHAIQVGDSTFLSLDGTSAY